MRTSFRIMKMTRTVFENKVAISTQKTVCNKMSNSIQTDKIYLNAMLEVIRWASNLDQYYRNAVVTKLASNVLLIIGEIERVVSLRKATVGERKKPAIQRYRKPVSH